MNQRPAAAAASNDLGERVARAARELLKKPSSRRERRALGMTNARKQVRLTEAQRQPDGHWHQVWVASTRAPKRGHKR